MEVSHCRQPTTTAFTPAGIAVGSLAVSDLTASATFNRALFGPEDLRECSSNGHVTWCVLGRADLDVGLALRLQDSADQPVLIPRLSLW